jgi:hypothetical protein
MAGVVDVDPERCPNGHPLGPGTVTKGWLPCLCVEGHAGHQHLVLLDVPRDHVGAATRPVERRTARTPGRVGGRPRRTASDGAVVLAEGVADAA